MLSNPKPIFNIFFYSEIENNLSEYNDNWQKINA